MRRLFRAALAAACLILLLAACQSPVPELAETPAATASATAAPTRTTRPTATTGPTTTPTGTPTETPEATITPPASLPTVEVIRPLPSGWQHYGNERFGIQIAAPRTWTDLTARLRGDETFGRFGHRLLLLANSNDAGVRLLAGAPLEQGAFAFGYVRTDAPDETAGEALARLLAELEAEQLALEEPQTVEVAGLAGALVDLQDEALGLFPEPNRPISTRMLLLVNPQAGRQYVFEVGTTAAAWEAYQKLFVTLLETVRLPIDRAAVNGHLSNGDDVVGTLDREVSDVWTFNASSGRYATINLTPDDAIDPTMSLIAPSGRVVATMDNGLVGDAEVLADILLTEDGTYLIEASEFFNEKGSYTLSLALADDPAQGGRGTIQIGAELTSELVDNREHVWLFQGEAGQTVSIILTSLEDQLDVILALQGPDGRVLAERDEGFAGDTEILVGYELPVSGEYAILVRGFGGHGGPYSLSLDEGAEQTENFYDAGDLAFGDSRRELLREDEIHAWFFRGTAGDEITSEVRPLEATLDMDVWLVDPQLSEQLQRKDEFLSGEAETINFVLPVNGQYVILVREFFGEPGEYEISLEIAQERRLEIVGEIAGGQTVEGTLLPGQEAGWTFEGQRVEAVSVLLDPVDSDADLVILLLDPGGRTAITIDAALSGAGEQLINFPLGSDGQWTLVVREFFNEAADYQLTLSKVEFRPTPPP